jgi:hypothetical protein
MSETTNVVTWADKLKGYAVAAAESEQPQGSFFSIKGGVLTFGGTPIPNNTMDVVVVGAMHENVFYKGRFNPDEIRGPACFAYSFDGKDMRPHDRAIEKQNPTCRGCKNDAWGSDPNGGRGKACKNIRRLCLMTASALSDPAKVASGQAGYLKVPVTSVANYTKFVAGVAAAGRPPFAVVCRVKVLPDPKNQVRVEFEQLHDITDPALLEPLLNRFEIEQKLISFPYEASPDAPSVARA